MLRLEREEGLEAWTTGLVVPSSDTLPVGLCVESTEEVEKRTEKASPLLAKTGNRFKMGLW